MTGTQINIWLPPQFIEEIDCAAKRSGATRSDMIRRSLEYYLREFHKVQNNGSET